MRTIKGYKGFDKDMKCRDFQYEVGKEYEEPEAVICESGFHFCENPLDILSYYDLCDTEFAKVEATGKTVGHDEDSKHSTTKIKITAKLDFAGFVKASVDFLLKNTKGKKTMASGNSSQLAASGDSSKLAASGDYSKLELNGDKCVGANIGYNGKIKGKVGCWITLAEYGDSREIKCVKSAKIDGKKLKTDTFYMLKNEKFVEVK